MNFLVFVLVFAACAAVSAVALIGAAAIIVRIVESLNERP